MAPLIKGLSENPPSALTGMPAPLVLASRSPARADLLRSAGLHFTVEAPAVDEAGVKESLRHEGASAEGAVAVLAELKATRVSASMTEAFVVGADQILDRDGRWFDKPANLDEAAAQLRALRGQRHELVTGVCVARDASRVWHHVSRATLVMRAFSDLFLERYLKSLGDEALTSIGAYKVEGVGAQLFADIDGDHFAILGLPLLPLLDFLRGHGMVME